MASSLCMCISWDQLQYLCMQAKTLEEFVTHLTVPQRHEWMLKEEKQAGERFSMEYWLDNTTSLQEYESDFLSVLSFLLLMDLFFHSVLTRHGRGSTGILMPPALPLGMLLYWYAPWNRAIIKPGLFLLWQGKMSVFCWCITNSKYGRMHEKQPLMPTTKTTVQARSVRISLRADLFFWVHSVRVRQQGALRQGSFTLHYLFI